ncbi:MAG: DNA-binding protein [Ruminococcaceae bacterium]|nr:DNA-binding protein [Oscillospiraceae bacterium]
MKEKDFSVCLLYDIYSPLLSEKKRTAFELSYWQDLSLSEIAEHTGTTRQGVRELIRRTCEELYTFEEALHIKKMQDELNNLAEDLSKNNPEISDKIKSLIN